MAPKIFRAWPADLVARSCEPRDAEALCTLFSQSDFRRFAMMDQAPFETPDRVRTWLKGNGTPAFRMVGTLDETIVGFAALYPLEGRQNHVGWITLGVHDGFRRRGIGTGLVQLLLATAKTVAGIRRVQLQILAGNDAAMALYTALGFEIEGRHKALVQDGGVDVDAYTMARLV